MSDRRVPPPVYDEGGWCIACGRTRDQEHAPFCVSVRRQGQPAACKRPGCDTRATRAGVCAAHLDASRSARS